jgi:hypothetical protein
MGRLAGDETLEPCAILEHAIAEKSDRRTVASVDGNAEGTVAQTELPAPTSVAYLSKPDSEE